MYKSWLSPNACASRRAAYLNLVVDSSDPVCINVLNIFFNIFGAPKQIISDNGSAFVGDETQLFVRNRNIKWTFNHQVALFSKD